MRIVGKRTWIAATFCGSVLLACGGGGAGPEPPSDAGSADGGFDAAVIPSDAGIAGDAGQSDAGRGDGGIADAGLPDAGVSDAGNDGGSAEDGGPPADGSVAGCTSCHGSDGNPAPPRDLAGHTEATSSGVGAHRSHLGASAWHRTGQCADCHSVPATVADDGHLGPPRMTWGEVARTGGTAPRYEGGTCSVYCHGETLAGGFNTTPTWTRLAQGEATCGACHGLPPPSPHPVISGPNCGGCHPFDGLTPQDPSRHIDGVLDVTASCGDCHGLPPMTGSHLVHAGLADPVYGGLGTAAELASPTGYAFGCGHCHPTNPERHRNGGLAEIELFDPTAPVSSLKAKNPANATYTPGPVVMTDSFGRTYSLGTCTNVACHSGTFTSTSEVVAPLLDTSDGGYTLTYDPPYTIERTPSYRSATWGGPALGCDGCHGYPPRAFERGADGGAGSVDACAGESHSCIDAQGYENLHNFNHQFAPLPCRACHAATVSEEAGYTRDAMDVTTLEPIPIGSFARHVNGAIDVVFDAQNPVTTYRSPVDLSGATYDASTKTCGSVPCHFRQTSVTFGAPYRWGNGAECNVCHRY